MADPNVSQVDIFDDFEDAEEITSSCCNKVSLNEFEEQMISTTDAALGELCAHLDQNPEIYASVLRKRKQEELESSGVGGFIWSKVMSVIHREKTPQCLVSTQELIKQTNALKAGMCKTFQYAQEINGKTTRHSERLAAKRKAKVEVANGAKRQHTRGAETASPSNGSQRGGADYKPQRCVSCTAALDAACKVASLNRSTGKGEGFISETDHSEAKKNSGTCSSFPPPPPQAPPLPPNELSSSPSKLQPPPKAPPLPPPLPSPLLHKMGRGDEAEFHCPKPRRLDRNAKTSALASLTNTPLSVRDSRSKATSKDDGGDNNDAAIITITVTSSEEMGSKGSESGAPKADDDAQENRGTLFKSASLQSLPGSDGQSTANPDDGTFMKPQLSAKVLRHKKTLSNTSIASTSSQQSLASIHSELTSSNPLTRLKATQVQRSPGGTPVRKVDPLKGSGPLHKALLTAMWDKFKNVNSPSPGCRKSTGSGRVSANTSTHNDTFSP